MVEVVEDGKLVGQECTDCHSTTYEKEKNCIVCENTGTIIKKGNDERCAQCWGTFVE